MQKSLIGNCFKLYEGGGLFIIHKSYSVMKRTKPAQTYKSALL